jgi:hypothetical protein
MEPGAILAGIGAVMGWLLVGSLRKPPKKARIVYLSKDRENYVRLRSNPGFTLGRFHWCRKGKMCSFRRKK